MPQFLDFLSNIFVLFIGLICISGILLGLYCHFRDKRQTKHTLMRNFPLIARGRWLMERWGKFFRPYMVESERDAKPFSKHDMIYVYRGAKGNKRTEAFGSTAREEDQHFSFIHSMFPYMKDNFNVTPLTFGEDSENPYTTNSRFNPSAMSFGALSKEAVLAISIGIKKAGGWMNTGEGGLSPYHLDGGADIVFQIGTGKINVANDDLTLNIEKLEKLSLNKQIKMFEIKLSQGAKPGKGGILPASKVNDEIAKVRGINAGEASISPNGHVEITDTKSLLELIFKVKKYSKKPTGIKLCIGSIKELDDLIKGIKDKVNNLEDKERLFYRPDFITLDSADGGTGAAPTAFMDSMGTNINASLPILIQTLEKYKQKEKIKVIVSGKLITPVQVAWAFCNGADSVNSARGFLFSLGCIQARECNKNTCPTGITTNNPKLTRGLVPENKAERVYNYHKNLTRDMMDIAHACGVQSFDMLSNEHIQYKKTQYNEQELIPIKKIG
jgi:glutamate synthase domain-containing protein 2